MNLRWAGYGKYFGCKSKKQGDMQGGCCESDAICGASFLRWGIGRSGGPRIAHCVKCAQARGPDKPASDRFQHSHTASGRASDSRLVDCMN